MMFALWGCVAALADDGQEAVPDEVPDERLDDFAPAPPGEDALPEALATRARVVPNTSFEFAVQYSFGRVAFLDDRVPPGPGLGLRGSWGKHLGLHRLGFAATETIEGDIGKYALYTTELVGSWDRVGAHGLLVGAGVGATLAVVDVWEQPAAVHLAPTVTARVGGSQTWSRYQRRLFVAFEAKLRVADGDLVPIGGLLFGAGRGSGEYRSR